MLSLDSRKRFRNQRTACLISQWRVGVLTYIVGAISVWASADRVMTMLRSRAWASYQIRKKCGLHMRRECRELFPRHQLQRKPLVSDPGMHHGTCITHVPWWMSGSLTRRGGKNVPGIPVACASRNFFYIWQKAHLLKIWWYKVFWHQCEPN